MKKKNKEWSNHYSSCHWTCRWTSRGIHGYFPWADKFTDSLVLLTSAIRHRGLSLLWRWFRNSLLPAGQWIWDPSLRWAHLLTAYWEDRICCPALIEEYPRDSACLTNHAALLLQPAMPRDPQHRQYIYTHFVFFSADNSTIQMERITARGLHDSIDSTAISFPHRSKPRLTSQIPAINAIQVRRVSEYIEGNACKPEKFSSEGRYIPFQRHVALLDFLGIKTDRGYGTGKDNKFSLKRSSGRNEMDSLLLWPSDFTAGPTHIQSILQTRGPDRWTETYSIVNSPP